MSVVVSKEVVHRYASGIMVVEGDVMTGQGEVTFCWVERNGNRVSEFTDIDRAMEIASEMLDQE